METELDMVTETDVEILEVTKNGHVHKVMECLKKNWNLLLTVVPKKILICAVAGVLFVLFAFWGYAYTTNNYMTPIRQAEKLANLSSYDLEKAGMDALNKVGIKQWKKILDIMHNSDAYWDTMKEAGKLIERNYEYNLDTYGEDYKLQLREIEKLELTKYELRDYRRTLQNHLNDIEDMVDSAEEFTSEDWRDFAEELDLTKRDAKRLVAEYGELLDDLGRLQVTEGYEVVLERVITGEFVEDSEEETTAAQTEETTVTANTEEAEEAPEYETVTIVVLKVNGRWVQYANFAAAYAPLNFM